MGVVVSGGLVDLCLNSTDHPPPAAIMTPYSSDFSASSSLFILEYLFSRHCSKLQDTAINKAGIRPYLPGGMTNDKYRNKYII